MTLKQIVGREKKLSAESAPHGNKNSFQFWILKVSIFRKMQEKKESRALKNHVLQT